MSDHWQGCWENENHPACRLQRIRELERELARRTTPTFAGYRPPVFLGAETHTPPPIYTHSVAIPCGDSFYTHHGDEPPSAAL